MKYEQQNLAWQCLPSDAKKEVKQAFFIPTTNEYEQGYDNALVSLFGIHNLTSDAEGEEILTAPRKDIIELYQEVQKTISQCEGTELAMQAIGMKNVIWSFFGSKCLPDEESKPAEPKFKKGDMVIYKPTRKVKVVFGIDKYGMYYVALPNMQSPMYVDESDLEPYTEPKNKDSGFIRAESVKEVRIASEESHLRNFSQETANCDKNFDNIHKDSFSKERRLNIAAMAMQGMLSHNDFDVILGGTGDRKTPSKIAELAVLCADALISELNKKKDGK